MPDDRPFLLPSLLQGASGVRAVEPLLGMSRADLAIDASGLRRIDAMSAAILRAAADRFTSNGGAVWVSRPHDASGSALLTGLLGDLASTVEFYNGVPPIAPHRDVVLAARRVRDFTTLADARQQIREADRRHRNRGQVRPGALLIEAASELGELGMIEARRDGRSAIVVACVNHVNDYQVAVYDEAPRALAAADHGQVLREMIASSEAPPRRGALYGLMESARHPSTLTLMLGNASLRWRSRPTLRQAGGDLSGRLIALEVHR
jgi:hypothetical protein